MFRKLTLFLLALILLGSVTFAQAQGGDPTIQHSDATWQASYWNNITLSGSPVIQRQDAFINFDWGTDSPDFQLSADHFSARWTRIIDVAAGSYRFTATSDDGVRVWVDDQLIIDQWHDHPAFTYSADIALSAGHHVVKVEYYENEGFAVAQFSWGPTGVEPGLWRASYFNNTGLSGAPALTRNEALINYDWGWGSPAPGLPTDYFSGRWVGSINAVETGTYRLQTVSDDGVRVYVDGNLVLNDWTQHPARANSVDVNLTQGSHAVAIEYYEQTGLASVNFTWERIDIQPTAWRGEYFNNRTLSGAPALVRNEEMIQFNWGQGAPLSALPADNFSVRWTRELDFSPGNYRFTTSTDDGVRLWVNGHLLIDQWHDQAVTSYTGTIYLSGRVSLKMEYYENGGVAEARLGWEYVTDGGQGGQGVVLVDDTDPGFQQGGCGTCWRMEAGGYNGRLIWTRNNDTQRSNYNWARWYPALTARRYEVFVYIPERFSTTSNARYWISHRDGFTLRIVDQSIHGGQWVSLGTYPFQGTSNDYVSLSDITYEPYVSRLIAFDAVKWEAR